ncbi:hypothetical protein HDE_14246 [Halotydeus destructor]|nr:hypothetical protein HDE_14246 [Halotydeus destructor]
MVLKNAILAGAVVSTLAPVAMVTGPAILGYATLGPVGAVAGGLAWVAKPLITRSLYSVASGTWNYITGQEEKEDDEWVVVNN